MLWSHTGPKRFHALPDRPTLAESGIPFELGIIRSHYVGRTFIQPTDNIRHLGVKLKHNANRALIEGKASPARGDSYVLQIGAFSDAVKADGVRARAELDALERRILGIGLPSVNDESAAERRRLGLDKADPAKRNAPRLAPTGGTGADKQVKELNLANKALESYAEQLQNTITKTDRKSVV